MGVRTRQYPFESNVGPAFKMFATRGHNLIAVGWDDRGLTAQFSSGAKWLYYGVPEETKIKLLKVPFPDKLFVQLVKSKGFKSEKIA